MDGEDKKVGVKKRTKSLVEINLDSDDDEPIGALLKLKKRSIKKVKLEVDGEKGKKVEVKGEKDGVGVVKRELVGMEDTLASFRKKLKGPKKDGGVFSLVKMVSELGELPDGCLGGVQKGEDVEVKMVRDVGEEVGDVRVDVNFSEKSEKKCDGKVRKHKSSSATNSCKALVGADDVGMADGNLSGMQVERQGGLLSALTNFKKKARRSKSASATKDHRDSIERDDNEVPDTFGGPVERKEDISRASDEVLTDSLSSFLRKAQSGVHKKPRAACSSKLKTGIKVSENDPFPITEGVSLDFQSGPVRDLLSDAKLCNDSLKSKDFAFTTANVERCSLTPQKNSSEDGILEASFGEGSEIVPIRHPKNTDSMTTDGSIRPVDKRSGDSSESLLEHSFPVSLVPESNCSLSACPENIVELRSSEVSREPEMIQGQLVVDLSDKFCGKDGYKLPVVEVGNNLTVGSQDAELHNGFRQLVSLNSCSTANGVSCSTPTSDLVEELNKPGKHEAGVRSDGSYIQHSLETSRAGENQRDNCRLITDLNEKSKGSSSPSVRPNENGGCQDDAGCLPESNNQCNERAVRRIKKRKDGDMAYEGDADWEVLLDDRRLLDSYNTVDRDPSIRSRDRLHSSNLDLNVEIGGSAAVSVGLKARAVGPVEKIKFKEVLKRKGGLQEYLECRNKILSLWSKDVTRILPLTDCGVTATPADNESSHASLMRDIYLFLDQSGYINTGIAANKEKADASSRGNYKLLGEKKFEGSSGASVTDSVDGVSFILGQVKSPDTLAKAKDDVALADENNSKEAVESGVVRVLDISPNKPLIDCQGVEKIDKQPVDVKPYEEIGELDCSTVDSCGKSLDNNTGPGQSMVHGHQEADASMQCDSGIEERNPVDVKPYEEIGELDCSTVDSCGKSLDNNTGPGQSMMHGHPGADASMQCDSGIEERKPADVKPNEEIAVLDCSTVDSCGKSLDNNTGPVQSIMHGHPEADASMQCDSGNQKRIIVVGAGPAGLTAARHLQRQGFSVTVVEARGRIGGRVYTDRSSLSVPVDLGASIITGVEADVASERRPDPSSLICAQLGLELTILNSDCPLYDIVTGEKVPPNVDEALEAEFNSLLDDMVLIIAQKGDGATRMSLEDGLEYGLKTRRKVLPGDTGISEMLRPLAGTVNHGNGTDACFVAEQNDVKDGTLSPLERRVMDWHFAHLEYGCAALLKEVSLPHWNQDDVYGGFGGAHCMIKGGYGAVVESIAQGLTVHLNQVVADISYGISGSERADNSSYKVKVSTTNGNEFFGDAILITVPLGCLKAESIKFSPPLPQWKHSAIQRLGFGVLNKVVLEFPEVFWDETVDYFGATAEQTNLRGRCFMFWNVKKTVGAPVLIALVVGKAALDGQDANPDDHVSHALTVLRKLFGHAAVPDPVASVVTDWGRDPFSYGAYSYVAVGASGEDYDIIGRPVENCVFFAGEATCKEHPDTVGGAMMSGLREAVRIIDILTTGKDYTAEAEVVDASQRQSTSHRNEVKDIARRLDAMDISSVRFTRESLLEDMFFTARTSAGRLRLAKELLSLPVESLKSFAGTREGLFVLNSWILDSMGKDGTQLLRHCVRILVRISTDLVAVRLSGVGKTVKEKVCVHTSRDIRAIASQLVNMWIEVFRKEKATNGGLKLLRHMTNADSVKAKGKDPGSRKPPLRVQHSAAGNNLNSKKLTGKQVKQETANGSKIDTRSSVSQVSRAGVDSHSEGENIPLTDEERAAIAAADAAQAAARAAAEAYASSGARCNMMQLPKIPSFQKFARREQYAQMDDLERKRWSGGVLGRQDCISEIDSRNCRVRDWSVDFSATCANLDNSRMSGDNLSQRSHSNDMQCQLNWREHSGESAAGDSTAFTKAWVESAGSDVMKDYHAIERWQCQAAAAEYEFQSSMDIQDEEDSSTMSRLLAQKHEGLVNESSVSQVTVNNEMTVNQRIGSEHIKQGVVDYVASLLMPLYKARKIDRDGYKSIMKKSATKVMEQTTDAEKAMDVSEFLDFKRKNKIRAFIDKLIERHMSTKPVPKT